MSAGTAIALAAVLAGGVVQSSTGFGFSIVAAPVVTAVYGPLVTAPTLTVLALLVNLLTLAAERRRPAVRAGVALRLLAWSVPGMVLGALLLAHAPPDVLRLAVAAAVLAAVAGYVLAARRAAGAARRGDRHPGLADAGTGLVAGAIASSTGVGGPPVVLRLLQRGLAAGERRDTLAAVFGGTGVLTIAILALAGAFRLAPGVAGLALAAVAGQVAGRALFARIEAHHEPVTVAVLVAGVLAAAVPAIQALGS